MSAWITHVKNFASRNKMTYGCALSDPRCKKEYHETKAKSARNPVKFTQKTSKRKPSKKVFKAEAEVPTPPTSDEEDEPIPVSDDEEPKQKEMPEVLQKLIQDFARPRPPEPMEKRFIKAREEGPVYYQFGESRTEDSKLLDEFDEFTHQLIKYKYAIPKKELMVVIYEVDVDNIPENHRAMFENSGNDRFYMIPEVNNFIYSFDELGYAVDSTYAQAERNDEEDEYAERQEAEGEEYTRYVDVEFDPYTKKNLKLYKEKNKKSLETAKAKAKEKAKAKKAKEKAKEKAEEKKAEEKPKEKDKALVEKAKKQLELMNRARDSGIEMDEDMREDLEDIVRGSGVSFWVEN